MGDIEWSVSRRVIRYLIVSLILSVYLLLMLSWHGSVCDFLFSAEYQALVVKASGLAAGKGVIVASTKEEACQAVRDIIQVTDKGSLIILHYG